MSSRRTIPLINTGSETPSPAYDTLNAGKPWFQPKVVTSPRQVLQVVYAQRLQAPSPTTQSFVAWKDPTAPAHAMLFTAAFCCPLTGELFWAAPYNTHTTPTNYHFKDGLWWFPRKKVALDAVAARVVDCWLLRRDDPAVTSPATTLTTSTVYARMSYATPYNDDYSRSRSLMEFLWPWLVPAVAVQQLRELQQQATASQQQRGNENETTASLDRMQVDSDTDGGAYSFYTTLAAWNQSASNRTPVVTLRQWYLNAMQGVVLEPTEQTVAWKTTTDDDPSVRCLIVCPVTGQLFLSPSSRTYRSVVEAQQGAAGVALQDFVQVVGLGHQPSPAYDLDDGMIDVVTVHRIHEVQLNAPKLPDVVRQTLQAADLDSLALRAGAATTVPIAASTIETPLKQLEHLYIISYRMNLTKDSFAVFENPESPDWYGCLFIEPFTAEVFPSTRWVGNDDEESIWYDATYGFWWCRNKSDAKLAAAAGAVDILLQRNGQEKRWGVEEDTPGAVVLPGGLLPSQRDKIRKQVQEAMERDPPMRIQVRADDEIDADNCEASSLGVDLAMQEIAAVVQQPRKPSDFSRNPIHVFSLLLYGNSGITHPVNNYLVWWKVMGDHHKYDLVYTAAVRVGSTEVFLARPHFRQDIPAVQEAATGIWWFRSHKRARRAAAALAFDCHCYRRRTSNDEWTPFFPLDGHAAYGPESAVGIEDLASKGLGEHNVLRGNFDE